MPLVPPVHVPDPNTCLSYLPGVEMVLAIIVLLVLIKK